MHLKLGCKYSALVETTLVRLQHSVDGSEMVNITIIYDGFPTSQLVQDFVHQHFVGCVIMLRQQSPINFWRLLLEQVSFCKEDVQEKTNWKPGIFSPGLSNCKKNTKNPKMDGLIPSNFFGENSSTPTSNFHGFHVHINDPCPKTIRFFEPGGSFPFITSHFEWSTTRMFLLRARAHYWPKLNCA